MNLIIFDLESVPNESLPEELIPKFYDARLKKPEVIKAHEEKFKIDLIKNMSVSPDLARIIAMSYSVYEYSHEKENTLIETMRDDLYGQDGDLQIVSVFNELMKKADVMLCGHNIKHFDLPLLWKRSMMHGVLDRAFAMKYRGMIGKYNNKSLDIMLLWDIEKMVGLEKICKLLGMKGKETQGSEIYDMWIAKDEKGIKDHCRDDVDKCFAVYKRMFPGVVFVEKE